MSTPVTTNPGPAAATFSAAYPLDEFYAQAGLTLPPLQQIDGEAVPEPFKHLLVHLDDMTPTLEKFHKGTIHIQVLSSRRTQNAYFREVVLLLDGSNKPVEFGAIKINLELFPEKARQLILEEHLPLGHILGEHTIKHSSQPKAYFRVASDKRINAAFKLAGAHILFGRRNTHFNPQGLPMAEIVEILPPA